jgi:hypothetical protein
MKNFVKIVLLLGAIMALGGIAAADDTDTAQVLASGNVPNVLEFSIIEANVPFGNIYADADQTVTVTGSGSSFSTDTVVITTTVTGHTAGDGHMYDAAGPHSLISALVNTITATKGALVIGPSYEVSLYTPGTFDLVTSYTQAYTDGDYAGSYSATIDYTATATW